MCFDEKKCPTFAAQIAGVVKLVDIPDLGSGAARHGGSSPFTRTFRSCPYPCGGIKNDHDCRKANPHDHALKTKSFLNPLQGMGLNLFYGYSYKRKYRFIA